LLLFFIKKKSKRRATPFGKPNSETKREKNREIKPALSLSKGNRGIRNEKGKKSRPLEKAIVCREAGQSRWTGKKNRNNSFAAALSNGGRFCCVREAVSF